MCFWKVWDLQEQWSLHTFENQQSRWPHALWNCFVWWPVWCQKKTACNCGLMILMLIKSLAVAPSHTSLWERTCNLAALWCLFSFYAMGLEIIKRTLAFIRHFVVNVQYIYFERADLEAVNQCSTVSECCGSAFVCLKKKKSIMFGCFFFYLILLNFRLYDHFQ